MSAAKRVQSAERGRAALAALRGDDSELARIEERDREWNEALERARIQREASERAKDELINQRIADRLADERANAPDAPQGVPLVDCARVVRDAFIAAGDSAAFAISTLDGEPIAEIEAASEQALTVATDALDTWDGREHGRKLNGIRQTLVRIRHELRALRIAR